MIETTDTLLFATGNPGKRREFESLLGDFINPNWRVFDLDGWPAQLPEIEEDKETFFENAVKKAFEASQLTGSVAIADDSGLEVDALDGRPGVYSARFAGPRATDEQNNRKLIDELRGVPESDRDARYVCVVAISIPLKRAGRAIVDRTGVDAEQIGRAQPTEEAKMVRMDDRIVAWFSGTVEGCIIDEPRGSGGFGYDPHFYIPQWDQTMAEVSLDKKNTISHRAEALGKLSEFFAGRP
jgi:XTP/dITP diphosphohydrolase